MKGTVFDYKFRAAKECDYTDICNLIKNKEELYLVYPDGNYPFTVKQVKELAAKRTELTIATAGDKIVGFANLYNVKPGEYAFIGNVVVDKKYRGKGIGKKIVQQMIKTGFNQLNLPEIRISVFSENTPAVLLYSRLGFVPYAIEARFDPDNNRVALLHMKIEKVDHVEFE